VSIYVEWSVLQLREGVQRKLPLGAVLESAVLSCASGPLRLCTHGFKSFSQDAWGVFHRIGPTTLVFAGFCAVSPGCITSQLLPLLVLGSLRWPKQRLGIQ
jgi:hypothetical protein